MAIYTYNSDGSYNVGLSWPPPATVEPTEGPDVLSGTPQGAITWTRGADLAIVFCVTDTYNASPFLPGYEIPDELPCRDGPFVGARTIPMSLLHQDTQRWGYLDDQNSIPGPRGCYCIHDWQLATQGSTIITVGISYGGSGANGWLGAISAMSGASLNAETNGLVLPGLNDATALAQSCFDTVVTYAQREHANSIDLVFTCDNTGSMGSRKQTFKNAAVQTTALLLANGYDCNFAFSTFAEWGHTDAALAYFNPSSDWGSGDDTPYTVRFPFGPLTEERQALFASETYPGEGGEDGPETALEALCRIYVARAAFELTDRSLRVHYW